MFRYKYRYEPSVDKDNNIFERVISCQVSDLIFLTVIRLRKWKWPLWPRSAFVRAD